MIGNLIFFLSCESSTSPLSTNLNFDEVIEFSLNKLSKSIIEIPKENYPIRTNGPGEWKLTTASAWTSGFSPDVFGMQIN